MVFPYMNMLSYWFYLLSVIVLLASFFVPGGPTGAGWTLYPPQAILPGTPGADWGIILMLVSLAMFIVAFTMGGLNYVTTVLQARTHGMTLMRMPLSVWGIFTATILGLLAFPALLRQRDHDDLRQAGHQLLHAGAGVDGRGAGLLRRQPGPVPAPVLVLRPSRGVHRRAARLRHRLRPAEHACAQEHLRLPHDGLGDRRDRRLSFVVWAHHMYVSGMNPYFGFFFATTTLIIAVPTAIKVYNWVLTLWRGNIHLTVPMLFAIGFIFTFIHGGLTGCSSATSRSTCRCPTPISWSPTSTWSWASRRSWCCSARSTTGTRR
jgi:cytochrome c oxidase subunit I